MPYDIPTCTNLWLCSMNTLVHVCEFLPTGSNHSAFSYTLFFIRFVYCGLCYITNTDTLEELRVGWKILKPNGVLVGIRAYPDSMGLNGVERALLQFCFEYGLVKDGGSYYSWYLIQDTSYMYYLWKFM